jgi:drug/metabolite transporter (DMT)-like permease
MTSLTGLYLMLALVAFAANSLLTRAALGPGLLDAASFALVRIATGAIALGMLTRLRPARSSSSRPSWTAALALAGYLAAFTVAYTRIGAAVGALLLFGAVQVSMVTVGLFSGERPSAFDWLGGSLAVAGLLVLTLPGAAAPDPAGAVLMVAAGACWGVYSLLGRGSLAPLPDTAVNFARTTALVALPLAWMARPSDASADGVWLATASGALASGVGYTLWYTALPHLSAWRAAILQLIVPVLTAAGANVLLDEPITARLIAAGGLVAVGVWFTSSPRWARR